MMLPRQAFRHLFLARVREFYRQPTVILWAYGFPLFLAIGLSFAFSGGLPSGLGSDPQRPVEVDVADDHHPREAALLAEHLQSEGLAVRQAAESSCRSQLAAGRAALLVVPTDSGYEYVYDARRPESLLARYRVDDLVQSWKSGQSWEVKDRLLDEPGSRYVDFLIPGLMGLNLMAGGLWGVGFVIVDLRVRKLLKRLLATPMRRSDFLLAIVGSRLMLLVPEMLLLALAGTLGFQMPMRGHVVTLALVILVGAAAFAGLGLLTACRLERTETMTGLINVVMLPMWMLSGTFFSPERFPEALRPVTHLLPLTPLNNALRQVILEGAGLDAVGGHLLVLCGWAVGCFLLALACFRWH